jgi:hypothetical protein
MTEKNFLVRMSDIYNCEYIISESDVYSFCLKLGYEHRCKGDLNNRPKWCPLVSVYESTVGVVKDSLLDEVKVWVEE